MPWRIFLLTVTLLSFMPAVAPGAEEKTIFWVDRFSGPVDSSGIPEGWNLEKNFGGQSKIAVLRENGGHVLYLRSVQDSFGLRKELSFDIKKFPFLQWRWKVTELPKGGDIRKKETDDQAGQIYVLFPRFPVRVNTRSIGYIWDATAPAGSMGTSTVYSRMKYVVLQSGPEKLGQWIHECRNVYEDYKKLFQEEPSAGGGVLLYINSQYTKSSADCYFSSVPGKK